MSNDTGTETTRSDAPSADDSLFGDAADDAADEQDANEETEQEPEGVDDSEGQAAADETGSSEDLKVVVSIKGGRATFDRRRQYNQEVRETLKPGASSPQSLGPRTVQSR